MFQVAQFNVTIATSWLPQKPLLLGLVHHLYQCAQPKHDSCGTWPRSQHANWCPHTTCSYFLRQALGTKVLTVKNVTVASLSSLVEYALRSPAARTVLLQLHPFVPAVHVKSLCGVAHAWLYLHVCLREPCKVQ